MTSHVIDVAVDYTYEPPRAYLIYNNGEARVTETIPPYFYAIPLVTSRGAGLKHILDLLKPVAKHVVDVEPTQLTPLLPFTIYKIYTLFIPRKEYTVFRVKTSHPRYIKTVSEQLEKPGLMIGANNIPYELRLARDLDVRFLDIPSLIEITSHDKVVELMTKAYKHIKGTKILVYDIEVGSTGEFPQPDKSPVLTITYYTYRLGVDNLDYSTIYKDSVILENKRATMTMSREIIHDFAKAILREQPAYIVGYNSISFDYKFLSRQTDVFHSYDSYHVWIGDRIYPHLDLYLIISNYRGALGIRNTSASSLAEISIAVLESLPEEARVIDLMINHSEMLQEYRERRELFLRYARHDVVRTTLLSEKFLPPIILLSAVTGMPISRIQGMNIGHISEILFSVFLMEKKGYAPVILKRELDFGKMDVKDTIYRMGKVYAVTGHYKDVLELDFHMLYPTIYYTRAISPVGFLVAPPKEKLEKTRILKSFFNQLGFRVLLGKKKTVSSDYYIPLIDVVVAPLYTLGTYYIAMLYEARRTTKMLKKGKPVEEINKYNIDVEEAKKVFKVVDQTIKILANATFGATSKSRGNLLNVVAGAYIFYYANMILRDVIEYVKRTGRRVVYADTDSVFIANVGKSQAGNVEKELNNYVKQRYGRHFELKIEGWFKEMLIPPSKSNKNKPARKTYILFNENGEPEVIKGIFFKIDTIKYIRDRLRQLYALIYKYKDVEKAVNDILTSASKLEDLMYYRGLTTDFTVNTKKKKIQNMLDKYKNLNKIEHHIAIVKLALMNAEGVEVKTSKNTSHTTRILDVTIYPSIVKNIKTVDAVYVPLKTRGGKTFIIKHGSKYYYVELLGYEKTIIGDKVVYHCRYSIKPVKISLNKYKEKILPKLLKRLVNDLEHYFEPSLRNSSHLGAKGKLEEYFTRTPSATTESSSPILEKRVKNMRGGIDKWLLNPQPV